MKGVIGRSALWLCVVSLSSVGYYSSTGFDTIWFALWVAPLPLLIYSYYRGVWPTLAAAFVVGVLGWASLFAYAGTSIPMKWLFYVTLVRAVAYVAIFLINRFLVRQFRNCLGIFVFPCLVVLYEFAFQSWSGFGTIGSLAYTQLSNLPIVQFAALAGNLGITFIIALLPAAVANAWYLRHNERQAGLSMTIMLVLVIAVVTFGIVRLHQNHYKGSVMVGLASVPALSVKDEKQRLQDYQKAVDALAARGAKIILLPEEVVTVTPKNFYQVNKTFSSVAKKNKVMIIVGVKKVDLKGWQDQAWIFGRQGTVLARYDRQHHLPGFSSKLEQGRQLTFIMTHYGPAAVAVNRDMDFINPSRSYSDSGVGLVFVPAKDFGIDSWFHARPAVFRGIEDDFSVVRASSQGLLSVSNPRGEFVARKVATPDETTLLLARASISVGDSFYARHAGWFGWFDLGFFVVLLLVWESMRIRRLKAQGKW